MLKVLIVIMLILPHALFGREYVIGINERDLFRYRDVNGVWQGKDIDLIRAVFRRTGDTFRIVNMPWLRVLKSIEAGEVDLTLAAADLPERKQYAWFSNHFFRYSHYMLFIATSKQQAFKSIKQLDSLRGTDILIGVLRGAVYSEGYFELLNDPSFTNQLAFIDNDQSLPSFVLKGRVDGYIDSQIEGQLYIHQQPEYAKNIMPLFTITTDEEAKSHLMFSKRTVNQAEIAAIDEALLQLHQSGEYDLISSKYLPK